MVTYLFLLLFVAVRAPTCGTPSRTVTHAGMRGEPVPLSHTPDDSDDDNYGDDEYDGEDGEGELLLNPVEVAMAEHRKSLELKHVDGYDERSEA